METLTALKRVITDVIRPEVRDDYALKQLDHMEVAFEDLIASAPTLFAWSMESLDTLRSILADLQSSAALAASSNPIVDILPTVQEALAVSDEPIASYPTLDELQRRIDAMRSALSEIIPVLSQEAANIPAGLEIQERIRTYLRQNAKRS